LNGEGITVLLTTHDLNTVASHIPWVICFNHGIIAQGTPGVILNPAILRQTFDADMVVIKQGDLTFIANRSLIHRHAGQQIRRRSAADGTTD
jgi:zinc/manganese transport system ATP-binding protein/zinc transport system ATP-binding protein